MQNPPPRLWSLALLLSLLAGCTMHSTATHWNRRVGVDGKPVFVKSTTNFALNVLVLVPLFGRTNMDEMVDANSAEIAQAGGDRLRVIETSSENYWYGFPPFTWILTPVISDIAIEYQPGAEELAAAGVEPAAATAVPASTSPRD